MNEQNRYYAFISYNGADEKWAKWLQHNLEYYRIPTTLCKEYPELPKNIRPIFWYKQDLSGTKLKTALRSELTASKYLIVICSPYSAKSDWVNDEIEAFIEQGKGDRIIPFIVGGTPHAKNPEEECFPPALRNLNRDEEIRGIDVRRKEGKSHALVDVIATMFGVRFDDLWQRHERRRKKIRNIWITMSFIFLLCAIGIYDYNRVKIEYYADFVDRWGVSEGIIPLDKDQVSHRHHSYKFEYTRIPLGEEDAYSWRLKRVSIVNSKGVISDHVPHNHIFFYPIQEYIYTDGYLTDVINRDIYKRVTVRYSIKDDHDYKIACLIDMEGADKRQGSAYADASTTSLFSDLSTSVSKSKIKRLHYTRNEDGYIVKVTYHANDGDDLRETAIGDNNNIYGKVFDLDSLGRVVKVSYINNEGNLMTDKLGVGHVRYTYSLLGEPLSVEYLDRYYNLTENELKFAGIYSEFDSYGNITQQWNVGIDGNPCFDNKNIYRRIMTYDDKGFMTETRYYDFEGNLSYCSEYYAIQRCRYDSKGRPIEESHYGADGNPCYTKYNYSILRQKYDSKDCKIEQCVYDTNGIPCVETLNGAHIFKIKYNKDNYVIEYSVHDTDKRAFISPLYGIHRQVNEYDGYHRLISSTSFDSEGEPCINTKESISKAVYSYDVRGNLTRIECFDSEGNRAVCQNGFAIIESEYDNYGNLLSEAYYGVDEEPVYIDMHSSVKFDYYPNGKIKESRYYDEKGELTLHKDWYSIVQYEYDDNGNQTKVSFLNTDSVPCYYKEGYAVHEASFDIRGNVIKEVYKDENGLPTMTNLGYSIVEYKHDDKNRIVEYMYFDNNHRPLNIKDRGHITQIEYDIRGNIAKTLFLGTDKRETVINGYSKIHITYDDKNNIVKKQYKDIDNNNVEILSDGYSSEQLKYDEQNRVIEVSYFDVNGKPCWYSYESGFICRYICLYDERNNVVEVLYYDQNGAPTMATGAARITSIYDEYNRMLERSFYGEADELVSGYYGKPIERYAYNDKGNITSMSLYNSDASPYATVSYDYDERGNTICMEIRDSTGNLSFMNIPNITRGAIAKNKVYWNELGQKKRVEYHDRDGWFNNEEGYAIELYEYDKFGHMTAISLFDENNLPIVSTTQKWHRRESKYNNMGLIAEEALYDENGKYVNLPWSGYCKVVYVYDVEGVLDADLSAYFTAINGEAVNVRTLNQDAKGQGQYDDKKTIKGGAIMVRVEDPGFFSDNGLDGSYLLLEWNNWCLYDDIVSFREELARSQSEEKHLLLIPYNIDGTYGEVFEVSFPVGSLGVRLVDHSMTDAYDHSVEQYEKWKGTH